MTKKMSGLAFAAVFVAQVAAAPDLKFNPRVAAPTVCLPAYQSEALSAARLSSTLSCPAGSARD